MLKMAGTMGVMKHGEESTPGTTRDRTRRRTDLTINFGATMSSTLHTPRIPPGKRPWSLRISTQPPAYSALLRKHTPRSRLIDHQAPQSPPWPTLPTLHQSPTLTYPHQSRMHPFPTSQRHHSQQYMHPTTAPSPIIQQARQNPQAHYRRLLRTLLRTRPTTNTSPYQAMQPHHLLPKLDQSEHGRPDVRWTIHV